MNFVDFVFFAYTFISLYMLSLFIFILLPNVKRMFHHPVGSPDGVSIVIPCYNAEKTIGKTIESLLQLDWPREMLEIIVVDDKSKDNSTKIVEKYAKKYSNVRLIVNEKNSGGPAIPRNIGVKAAKFRYVAVTDDDSTPNRDVLHKMIGFIQSDDKVAGVTCAVLAKEPETFMQKIQAIEYTVIAFNRKLLDMVDSVYVTPGPFALYRKDVLIKVGLFDPKNLTEDIEIVWRMLSKGYRVRMSLSARVYSLTPDKFKKWWRQRIRWNLGGTQTLIAYKGLVFRNGMLGLFIIPFFSISLFLGLFGLGLFTYLIGKRLFVSYLSTKYSLYASTAIIRLEDITFAPSILNFFGVVMFFLGIGFTLLALEFINDPYTKKKNLFNILFYMLIYLSIYPFIMITALSKLVRGKYSWFMTGESK